MLSNRSHRSKSRRDSKRPYKLKKPQLQQYTLKHTKNTISSINKTQSTLSNKAQFNKLITQRNRQTMPFSSSTTSPTTTDMNVDSNHHSNVHSMSINGFSGENSSQQYDQVRPSYPPEVIETILTPIFNAYSSSPESRHRPMRILDLGCGTGIFTKLMAIYMYEHVAESCEYEIYSVDPNTSMVNVFRSSLTIDGLRNGSTSNNVKNMSNGDLENIIDTLKIPFVASVDELPYKSGFFDGVIAAQAFHWFASPQSLINIQRCLTPNGIFSFCWNYWISTQPKKYIDQTTGNTVIPSDEQWMHDITNLIQPLYNETNTPHQCTINFPQFFTNHTLYERYGVDPPFNELHSLYLDMRTKNSRWMTRDLFHKRVDSISVVKTMNDDKKTAFLQQIDNILEQSTTPFRINQETGDKEYPIGFWCEIHYAQNSKGGGDVGMGFNQSF